MTTTTLHVTGMTCGHCVKAVTEELGAVDGVDSVEVELVTGGTSAVTVVSAGPVSADALRAAVDEAGYELVDG
jgi:copper chaperone CopZ